MTNGDKLRSMTDEELSEFLWQISRSCIHEDGCRTCPIYPGCAANVCWQEKWLKQEVSEDAAD
jgi:hypothetical protein